MAVLQLFWNQSSAKKTTKREKEQEKEKERHRQLGQPTNIEKRQRSSHSMEKAQRDKHHSQPTATATQNTITAPHFTNRRRNASPVSSLRSHGRNQ